MVNGEEVDSALRTWGSQSEGETALLRGSCPSPRGEMQAPFFMVFSTLMGTSQAPSSESHGQDPGLDLNRTETQMQTQVFKLSHSRAQTT